MQSAWPLGLGDGIHYSTDASILADSRPQITQLRHTR
jgi:hypothetical protein